MLFKPHPIQVQALRIAKRFQLGFRPMKVAGKPVTEASILGKIKFYSVPAFVLSAEIGYSTEYGSLIEELCQRGYLAQCDGYPKCLYPPMEYVTENGTKVCVHDEHWRQIDVLPRDAKSPRQHVGGFSGVVHFGGVTTPPRRRRKPKIVGKGSCYELTPKGFDLLDQVEAESRIDPEAVDQVKPSHKENLKKSCAKLGDWNALTDRQRNCMRALHEFSAFDADSRQRAEDVAVKAEGRDANVNGFKDPLSDLVRRGLADSKTGREGGYWLTDYGHELLTAFDANLAPDNPSP